MLDNQREAVNQYKDYLIDFNKTVNITSKKNIPFIDFHINDSLALADLVANSNLHVDFGSGSGLPAVLIAIYNKTQVICIESKQKKRVFLNQVKTKLGLSNLSIYDADVQTFAKHYHGPKIESFSAKAFAKPPQLLTYLSLFKPSQYDSHAFCWVPVSKRQAQFLHEFDDIVEVGDRPYYYFKVALRSFRSYKADLKNRYNL